MMNASGELADKSLQKLLPQGLNEQVLTWYKNMLTGTLQNPKATPPPYRGAESRVSSAQRP
jgi:hypothetical protein